MGLKFLSTKSNININNLSADEIPAKPKVNISSLLVKDVLIRLLKEFDIEYKYEDTDVYNANAINQLLTEIFVPQIEDIQNTLENKIEEKEDKRTYAEVNINYNPNNNTATLRNWVTENPYEVIDKANKKGKDTTLIAYLYVNDTFFETVYMAQSLYSDNPSWGHFKYWLGFSDDKTMAYLRLNSSGTTICGIKIFN